MRWRKTGEAGASRLVSDRFIGSGIDASQVLAAAQFAAESTCCSCFDIRRRFFFARPSDPGWVMARA
jgi:hypothetical protein